VGEAVEDVPVVEAIKRTYQLRKRQHTATHCNTLQHTATHYNTLQHTATHCMTYFTEKEKKETTGETVECVPVVEAINYLFFFQ